MLRTDTITTTLLEKPMIDKKVKRHSIHGMMEEENVIRPHQEIAQLSLDEKKFLLAVERGDVASTRRTLQKAEETGFININCVDPLGRSALLMAIDNENLEMVELLIEHRVETKDALLHAISEEFVEAVEVLLDHEETIHKPGEPHSWEALPPDTATFTPDITPLILSAHRDNYEIIKILLDRGATLPMPHDVRCGCDECVTSRMEDSLRHSRSRINAYRALASPSLIALSSKDPILTAFELSWELRRLSLMEHEFKSEYQELRKQCQDFATALLDHTRSSYELEVLLNHDPTGPAFEHGDRMHLNRLKLAIKLRQKKDVILYIIDNYANFTSSRVCGSVLQSYDCPSDDFEWSIKVPSGNSVERPKSNDTNVEIIKILQLSDIHYDPEYTPNTNAVCDEPICCQKDQGEGSSPETSCGYWSDYRAADVPWYLVEETVRQAKTEDVFLYILGNYANFTSNRVCGSIMQSYGCPAGDAFEWSINIPSGNSIERPKPNDTKIETFNILQLSDIHYDPNYKPYGNADCGEPICCQEDQGEPNSTSTTCGYWTDYRGADVPWHLIEETIRQTKTQKFDYVYYTGDIISHRVWETSIPNNTDTIRKLYSYFKESFDVPVYPIFGNHEPHPLDLWPTESVQDEQFSIQWLFELAAELWSQLIGEDVRETVLKGGYYTVSPRPGFRIIAINSNLGYVFNWWLLFNDIDPYGQLQWLADTLKQAEDNNESVHILSHVPTGTSESLRVWGREYSRIVERFANTITGQFNGHTHKDEFEVYYNSSDINQAVGVVFNGASLTPYSNSNPSYKLYQVDSTTFFVAHSNVQQLLASIWYEGLPGFRRKNMVLQALEIVRIGILFPFFSIAYIVAPHSVIGQTMRKPFIKFICHSASYFTFLFMLSQTLFFDHPGVVYVQRGAKPSIVEWIILSYVSGLIWSEIKQLWDVGLEEYVRDMWNVIDFITNSLYVATVALRVVSIYQIQKDPSAANVPRKDWDAWDPMLISEGLFSAANIFSSLKLVYIFSVNPHLGPLQVSLSRMVMDIMKFFFLYVLVLFAFSCGLNQLLSYYAKAERDNCPSQNPHLNRTAIDIDSNACTIWRRFSNLFETSQTLFWAVFGLVDLESFELNEIKIFTRFWGMLMFGTYSVINIVVLLNLLIAMMNHSYQLISERADTEWKFARSKLWISYFEEGGTAPPPFNIIPTPKSVWYVIQWIRRKFCGHSRAAKKEHMRTIRRKVKQASERDFRYQSIMRNLVRRYVTVEQRKAENQGVTEDDVNEIKQDISAFRFELIEILKNSGMNTSTAHSGMGTGGKKNRQKERRLMKGFNIGPQPSTTSGPLPPVAEFIASLQHHHEGHHHDFFGSTLSGIFNSTPRKLHQHSSTVSSSQGSINEGSQNHQHNRGIGRFHLKRSHSHKRRWGTLIEAAKTGKVSRLIGRSRSEDSVCNNCRENGHNHSHSHSNSPASDDNGSVRSTDSNPSLDVPDHPEPELHGLAHGLALLKKKRKKFSASRNTSPIVPPPNTREITSVKKPPKKIPQVLKRASSVPTRVPEVIPIVSHHEKTQSQQDSVEIPISAPPTLTPSTTEESVTAVGQSTVGVSREPLLYYSSSSNQATGSSQTPEEEFKGNTSQSLPKLPGVIPLSGHNGPTGWL